MFFGLAYYFFSDGDAGFSCGAITGLSGDAIFSLGLIGPDVLGVSVKFSFFGFINLIFYKGTKLFSYNTIYSYLFSSIFIIMKKETTKLNITLPTDLITKIKDGNYNRTKLLVSLLKDHINKIKK